MSLLSETRKRCENRKKWLEEAERAYELVTELPAEIQNLDGEADVNETTDGYELVLSLTGGEPAIDTLRQHGIQDLVRQFNTFTGKYYYTNGTLPIGIENKVGVSGNVTPRDCKIEEYKETVTRYREVCEGDLVEAEQPVEVA